MRLAPRQHLSRPRSLRRGGRRLLARHRHHRRPEGRLAHLLLPRRLARAEQALAGSRGRSSSRRSSINPNQPQVLNYLGYSWVDMGLNLDEALDMIKTAVDLRPNDGYIVDSLGWAYYRLGRYDEAVEPARARRRTEAGRFGHQRPSRRRLLAGRTQARGDVPVGACARPRSRAGGTRQDRQEARERHDRRWRPRRLTGLAGRSPSRPSSGAETARAKINLALHVVGRRRRRLSPPRQPRRLRRDRRYARGGAAGRRPDRPDRHGPSSRRISRELRRATISSFAPRGPCGNVLPATCRASAFA